MQLTIQVHSYCGNTPADVVPRVFNSYPIIIGRSLDCDFVLEDTSKYVSSHHAVISLTGDKLLIEDTSVNGVYVGGAIEPLGRGNSCPLSDGDTIIMGDYAVGVSIKNELLGPSSSPADTFSSNEVAEGKASSADHYAASPMPDDDLTPVSGQTADHEDWDLSFLDEYDETIQNADADADWDDPVLKAKPSSTPATPVNRPDHALNSSPPGTVDPDGTPDAVLSDSMPDSDQLDYRDDGESNLAADPEVSEEEAGAPLLHDMVSDNMAAEDEPDSLNPRKASTAQKEYQTPEPIQATEKTDKDLNLVAEQNENAHAADAGLAGPMPREALSSFPTLSTDSLSPANASNLPEPENQYHSLDAFLSGIGIDPNEFANLNEAQVLREAGALVNQAVEGIMLLLKSRSDFKDSIHSEATILTNKHNNPLKFSQNGQEALLKLLASQSSDEYLDSHQAMKQALEDLQLHQLAIIDGMKAAATSMLTQFNPEQLAGRLEERNPIVANIPIKREAELWGLFNDKYYSICEDVLSDFSDLFAREFHLAYEKRIKARGRAPDF